MIFISCSFLELWCLPSVSNLSHQAGRLVIDSISKNSYGKIYVILWTCIKNLSQSYVLCQLLIWKLCSITGFHENLQGDFVCGTADLNWCTACLFLHQEHNVLMTSGKNSQLVTRLTFKTACGCQAVGWGLFCRHFLGVVLLISFLVYDLRPKGILVALVTRKKQRLKKTSDEDSGKMHVYINSQRKWKKRTHWNNKALINM